MVLASTNGIEWHHASASVQLYCNSIAYGGGQAEIVGGGTLKSSDCLVWTSASPGPWGSCYELKKVRYGFDRFVAGGNSGTLLSSSDGAAWSIDYQHGDFAFRGIAFGDESAVSVGVNVDNQMTLLTAGPDLQWSAEDMSGVLPAAPDGWVPPAVRDVAFGAGHFVAVGDWQLILRGTELRLPPILSLPRRTANGAFEFQLTVQKNRVYRIEASEDMSNWGFLTNLANQSGTVTFTDTPSASAKFYRVVLQ